MMAPWRVWKKKPMSPRYLHLSIDLHLTQVDRWSIRSFCLFCTLHHLHAISLLDQSTWSSSLILVFFLSPTHLIISIDFKFDFLVSSAFSSVRSDCLFVFVVVRLRDMNWGKEPNEKDWHVMILSLIVVFAWIFVTVFHSLSLSFLFGKNKIRKMFSTHNRLLLADQWLYKSIRDDVLLLIDHVHSIDEGVKNGAFPLSLSLCPRGKEKIERQWFILIAILLRSSVAIISGSGWQQQTRLSVDFFSRPPFFPWCFMRRKKSSSAKNNKRENVHEEHTGMSISGRKEKKKVRDVHRWICWRLCTHASR